MKTKAKIAVFFGAIILMVVACSTEKNTWVNRNYHSLTAHYNGYYNANELIDKGITDFRSSRIENYYEILPIDPIPNEKEVPALYPAIDTAIVKCKKVIRNHSMPSNDRPARKKEEHNRWIDENWTTIGIASYYRRDYEGAMKSFKFVRKFYTNDPSLYVGELWMAKTNIATGNFTEAKFNLDNLDRAIAQEAERKEEKSENQSKKKKSKKDEIAKVPKEIRFDLEKTKADLALIKGEKDEAIGYLEASLEHAGFHDDQARVHFILGQLYAEKGENVIAKEHFTRVVKSRAKYEMAFNAKLKRAFLSTGEKEKKDLNKMLKDPKNAEYKDQIYYALAEISFNEGDDVAAIHNLHQSAFYSTTNTRQKGLAYERLGDYNFERREYVSAQKYYDSCAQVINDEYPNAEGVRGKAENLAKLVVAVETANREDSLQRIAMMNDDDRVKFIEDVIKKRKEEEAERKRREEERLRELQDNENLFVEDNGKAGGYWSNPKAMREGREEFKRLWGERPNEDDWRRSQKIPSSNFETDNSESGLETGDSIVASDDTLTVEHLLTFVPLTDSSMELSNGRLMKAYFDAGRIYNEQLKEPELAKGQFQAVLDKDILEDPHDVLSAFQLYNLYNGKDAVAADRYRNHILNNYPNSDYANYLRDPEYFIKKKERDALAVEEYVKVLDRYGRRLFRPVITKADKVINEEKDNIYRSKYMLLKAMCLAELNEDKTRLLPVLELLVEEYPETEEAERGREMINIIKNGYSANIQADFGANSPFKMDEDAEMHILVILPPKISTNTAITSISSFNKEYFKLANLEVDTKLLGLDQSVIIVDKFEDEIKASAYITAYKNTNRYLQSLNKADIYMISMENMRVLFQTQDLKGFEEFYQEYY